MGHEKIRVMFVMLQLDAGGSERVVFELARHLDASKFEVYVAAFKGGVLAPSLRKICRKLFFVRKRSGFDPLAMLSLSQLIRDHQIDVVNAHHYMPFFYSFVGTKVLNRRKLFYTEHSLPEVEHVHAGIHGKIFYRMLFLTDGVVGISREMVDKFKQYYPRHFNRFHTILNGVQIRRFQRFDKGLRDAFRNRLKLTKSNTVVGIIANFRKVKNHCCLVRAGAHLKESMPGLRFVFVGEGFSGDLENSESEVRALIKSLDMERRIHLVGYQENIPEMLSLFDIFCLPSFSEGLPVSLLEAMAAGVPVIGSRVNGITEVITDQETGLLFPSDDDTSLACQLKRLMESPELSKRLADKAFDFVKNRHSHHNWVRQYVELFQGGG